MKNLARTIEDVATNFESEPWSENVRLPKETFDIDTLKGPLHYSMLISDLDEVARQSRFLFLCSIFTLICKEEGVDYEFSQSYEAGMKYTGVKRQEGAFYIKDEDGHYRDIFTSAGFFRFIDDLYWELYEES